MKLKENKKIALSLIEEFSQDSEYLTQDEDIRNRLNHIYNTCQNNLARIKKITKIKDLEFERSSEEKYIKIELPDDMYKFKNIIVLDEKTNSPKMNIAKYNFVGDDIYVDISTEGKHILEYYAYPKQITYETDDEEYELEIDADAQNLLPYAVASDILKTDLSADYTAFENKYRYELQSLDPNKKEMTLNIEEGDYNF